MLSLTVLRLGFLRHCLFLSKKASHSSPSRIAEGTKPIWRIAMTTTRLDAKDAVCSVFPPRLDCRDRLLWRLPLVQLSAPVYQNRVHALPLVEVGLGSPQRRATYILKATLLLLEP